MFSKVIGKTTQNNISLALINKSYSGKVNWNQKWTEREFGKSYLSVFNNWHPSGQTVKCEDFLESRVIIRTHEWHMMKSVMICCKRFKGKQCREHPTWIWKKNLFRHVISKIKKITCIIMNIDANMTKAFDIA